MQYSAEQQYQNFLQEFENINAAIWKLESVLPSSRFMNEELSNRAFMRQRLYALRCDMGQIYQYCKQNEQELIEEIENENQAAE